MEERLRSHYESLSRAIGFTRTADNKAAPALALQVALAGTLAARFEKLAPIIGKEPWGVESVVLAGLLLLYAVSVIGVVAFAASVYMPRNPRTGGSLIYFEDIAAMPFETFQVQAGEMPPDTMERQLLGQIHTVSGIASAKMRRVRWAYYLSGPSVIFWIILLVLQRRFLNLVSFWPEIASRKARQQSCQARGQVAMKRCSRSISCEQSL